MQFGDNHFRCQDAETGEIVKYYEFAVEKLWSWLFARIS